MEYALMGLGALLALIAYGGGLLLLGFALALPYAKYYHDGSERSGERKSDWFQQWLIALTRALQKHYLGYKVLYEGASDLETRVAAVLATKPGDTGGPGPAIFAAHPHGGVPIGSLCHVAAPVDQRWCSVTPCTHRHVFSVPVVRELALALGAIDVTRENMKAALARDRSIYVVPGGCREMIVDAQHPLQTRHSGFLHVAYTERCPVYPVLHLGQDDVFATYSCAALDKLRAFTLDCTGYPFPTFFSWPRPRQLTTYVCEPLRPGDYNEVGAFIDAYFGRVNALYQKLLEAHQGHKPRSPSIEVSI